MKSKNCPQGIGSLPIDSRTTQAFRKLRLHAEEMSLELTVRLRVLGKSLAAACPGSMTGEGEMRSSASYASIRRQLDGFIGSLLVGDNADHRYLSVIHNYLQETLPPELNGCWDGNTCRIEVVENAISLLSECAGEGDKFTQGFMVSFSS